MCIEEYKELYKKIIDMSYDWEGFNGDDLKDKDQYYDSLKKAILVDLMKETLVDVPIGHIRHWCKKENIDLQKEEDKYWEELCG